MATRKVGASRQKIGVPRRRGSAPPADIFCNSYDAAPQRIPITLAVQHPDLFQAHFDLATWHPWLTVLRAAFGEPIPDAELPMFRQLTGRANPPTKPCRDLTVVAGRRAGKSSVASLLAVYLACFVDWTPKLRAGELATVGLVAADRTQATVCLNYVKALLDAVPLLKVRVTNAGIGPS